MSDNDNLEAASKEPPSSPQVPPEMAARLVKEFFDNQSRELELRKQQLDLEKQKDDHAYQWARQALEAQLTDREKDRAFQLAGRRNSFFFAAGLAVLFVLFLSTALWLNKDEVVLEIVKAAIFITTGGAGGYAIGRRRIATTFEGKPDAGA